MKVRTGIAVAALALALAGCGAVGGIKAEDKGAGMPLDSYGVTEYGAPVWWPDAQQCMKVRDRQTSHEWWVLRVKTGGTNGHGDPIWQYVVLDDGVVGKEAE